jgi:hypothetical protein
VRRRAVLRLVGAASIAVAAGDEVVEAVTTQEAERERVVRLWDQNRVSGRWFAEQDLADGPIAWDACLLFSADGRWRTVRLFRSAAAPPSSA